ncbi:hypothetical protein ACJMK2_038167 [Sinanodonta woodiana]|uniref:CCHC-type domain-containing protein n=1 Tax=Sinanodonta woodiana TaxID=1069815 RepID=A0ABD3WR49_SINWO
MARINRYLTRFIDNLDPHRCLVDEYFLKALPPMLAQWIRRNMGNGSVVDAAEDYVLPINESKFDPKHSRQQANNQASSSPQSKKIGLIESSGGDKRCYKCHQKGHVLRDCPVRNKQNHETYFVQNAIGERLIKVPETVNDMGKT